jgi:hypothetical protein
MATKLTFQHFICEEGTSEQGDESPYFLTWVGNVADNVSTVHYTRQAVWNDNVPENPNGVWLVNEAIVRNFQLTFAFAVRGFLEDPVGDEDELMEDTDGGILAARKINLAAANKLPEVVYRDHSGGRYRARFKLD